MEHQQSNNTDPDSLLGELLPADDSWKAEWKNMPEFVQDNQKPYARIVVNVHSEEDLQELAKALGQPLTKRTKSAHFPFRQRGLNSGKRYVDGK